MKTRVLIVLSVAASLAVAALIVGPLEQSGGASPMLNLTAPTTASNCQQCHAILGESDVPGLIFSHGNHLLITCPTCHVRVAHEEGHTYRPTMDTCFLCHGLAHGAQGVLAAGQCSDCHTPVHVLRPASHVETWAAEPHAATARKGGVNRCMMCHEAQTDCDECHVEEKVDVGPMPRVYLRLLPVEPERPDVLVDTGAEPVMSTCVFCHPQVAASKTAELIFTHDPHLERDYDCSACHPVFPHALNATQRPDMQSCYRCHSLIHSKQGDFAPEECDACHPKTFELMPASHTPRFVTGEHKDDASADVTTCTMCHKSSFCVPCHNGAKKLADGRQSPLVIPADHRKPEWKPDHGRRFLGQQGACSTCHAAEFCTLCHKTPMPHPPQWASKHTSNGYDPDDCYVCHEDRAYCQECHHSALDTRELVAENCVPCHEEMKTDPPTKIKNIGLAEHAVHFDVTEQVGRHYVCEDCHIGFTVARVMQPASQTQVHDLRICYDCHGNLNVNNVAIAPYPGSELCRRCHVDLDI